ncbi:MAG: ABC transporter substrate-binding protein [Beijerinckiaceae bacterium]|jgi:4,5-dihydroxyphthalate decarboxylase|nr:ABC transporter substrate-binding protein [Beijerinckiaceae bacterium]
MADLKLTLACWDYDRTRPLIDGRVKPKGIDLEVLMLRPREMFPRMLERKEFHASELSLASYASLLGRGDTSFRALPVAVSKFFRHSCIYVRPGAGIEKPEDLRGKRVGTTQYGSTAAVFMKGMMQDEYGVSPNEMKWYMGGLTKPTEAPLIPLTIPDDVDLEFLPDGKTLEAMMEAGELDALYSIYLPKIFLAGSPNCKRLFPNFKEVEKDYYRRTKIFPIMHTIALRDDVLRDHPWVAQSLFDALREARDIAVEGLYDTDALRLALPWLLDHVEEAWSVFGENFWAYGFDANRPTLAALGRYVHEQGLSPRIVLPEELFLPGLDGG